MRYITKETNLINKTEYVISEDTFAMMIYAEMVLPVSVENFADMKTLSEDELNNFYLEFGKRVINQLKDHFKTKPLTKEGN